MCHILLLTVSLLIATPIHCQYFITADSHCLAIGTNSLTNITQVFWSPISYSTSSNCVNWAFEKHFNQETQSIYNGKLYVNGIGANAMNKATYLNQRMYAMMDSTPINIKADPITHVPLIESLQNDSFSASSYYNYKVSPYDARRTSGHAWVPSTNHNPVDYLQVDLGEQHPIESVSVYPRADGSYDQWVTTYTLSYSIDGQTFEDYPATLNGPLQRTGPTGEDGVDEANSVLFFPIIARYLRFTPLTYVWHKAMRVEAYRRDYYDEFQFDFNQNRLMNKKMNICTLGMDANDTRFVLIDNTTIDGYAALFDCNNSYALRSASITITYHELYYVFQKKMLDFDDSDALCRFSYDSHLASIHSDHQNEEAIGMSVYHQTAPPCWFGLNDIETEGTWTNRDATPWDYGVTVGSLPWNTTQPSGSNALNCATLAPRWSDSLCQSKLYSLCNHPQHTVVINEHYSRSLSAGNLIGIIDILDELYMAFDIVIHSWSQNFTNILHIGNANSDQMYPAIFSKSSNSLQFTFTNIDGVSQDSYQNPYAMNLDTQYHLTLYRTQQHITITVNDEKVVDEASPSHPVVFNKRIYVSDPWYDSANATVSNLFISTSNSHAPNEFNYLCDAYNRLRNGAWVFNTNECTVQSSNDTESWNVVWLATPIPLVP
eukprot:843438_1